MSVQIDWRVPQRVLLATFEGNITVDDLAQASIEGTRAAASGKAPVYYVIKVRRPRQFPTNYRVMYDLMTHGPKSEKITHVMLICNGHPLVRFIALVLFQLRAPGVLYHVFSSVDEACAYLHRIEPELAWDPLYSKTGNCAFLLDQTA